MFPYAFIRWSYNRNILSDHILKEIKSITLSFSNVNVNLDNSHVRQNRHPMRARLAETFAIDVVR